MNFETYQTAAKRTLASIGDNTDDFNHMILGLITESGELSDIHKRKLAYGKAIDKVNQEEEVGDYLWYLNGYMTLCAIDVKDVLTHHIYELNEGVSIPTIMVRITELSTSLHRVLNRGFVIGEIISYLKLYCKLYDLDIERCMGKNITKLYTRYPDNFSADKALVRDLEAERKSLES